MRAVSAQDLGRFVPCRIWSCPEQADGPDGLCGTCRAGKGAVRLMETFGRRARRELNIADEPRPRRRPQVGRPRASRPRGQGDLSLVEFEVLCSIAIGETSEETATRLGKSPHTIRSQRLQLYHKLDAKTGAHAVAIAFRRGLLER